MPQLTRHRRLGANPSPHRCRAPRWRATEARLRRHKWAHTSRASFLTATVLVTGCRAARGRASSTHALEGILHEGKSSIVRFPLFPFYQKSIAKTYNSYLIPDLKSFPEIGKVADLTVRGSMRFTACSFM